MTKEENTAWVKSLKHGEMVIYKGWGDDISPATVLRITPSGIVRTDKGSFNQSSWTGDITGYGKTSGRIVPATDELLEEARNQEEKRKEEKHRTDTIRKAQSLVFRLYEKSFDFDYPTAERIIDALGRVLDEESKN